MSANNPKGSDGMQLDDRKTIILQAIIRNYLETGEPVGSRTISKYTDLNLSSATIRNEMADLEEMGYTCNYYSFSDSNDLASVATTASGEVDVLYVPTDNTVASNTEIINNIFQPAGIPVVTGEEGICAGCGVATLSISYYDLGVATGKMAVRVLNGEDISTMPVEYAPNFVKKYNKTICDALNITVPDDYEAIEE